jgi:hypothetical protein
MPARCRVREQQRLPLWQHVDLQRVEQRRLVEQRHPVEQRHLVGRRLFDRHEQRHLVGRRLTG